MGVDVPPLNSAAAAIVRQAENQKQAETLAKRQAEMERRRREQALRDAAAQRRIAGTGQQK